MAGLPTSSQPLRVLIVGAGIGGLTAAIALRQQGHDVTIFEQSKFSNETGAAIHVAPNADGCLRRLGFKVEDTGANQMEGFAEYAPNEELRYAMDVRGMAAMWQNPWNLAHRVHLHQALRKAATGEDGKGKPAELKLGSKIVEVDVENAKLTLATGKTYQGDLVVGADGVGSATRKFIPGGDNIKPFDSGKSAYRFLIPKETLLNDPATRPFVETTGRLIMWIGEDRRVVIYPTSNNTISNFVCIFPSKESESAGGEWNQQGHKDRLTQTYKDFGPNVRKMLEYVDPAEVKVWTLLDMEVLPSWVNGRLCLMGDAAHPFLPHQGQGGGMAMEDALSLAAVLQDSPREEIPERLKLYQECRKYRADRIQEYTRMAGRDLSEITKSDGKKLDMNEYTMYNFGHDEWHNSCQKLREWHTARNPNVYRRMPITFGPAPGPRQDVWGRKRPADKQTYTTATVKFRTSRTLLQNLLPQGFSFAAPVTVCQATWRTTTLDNMDWLGGGGYNFSGLWIHGVKYTKKDGSVVHGSYIAVLFENLTDPIVTGREELGMPKLYSEIEIFKKAKSRHVRLSWRGATFVDVTLDDLDTPPATNGEAATNGGPPAAASGPPGGPPRPPPPKEEGEFGYKYIPAVGKPGQADADYATFIPYPKELPQPSSTLVAKNASLSFQERDWASLPTLHHVAARLAEIPVFGIVEAKIVEGSGVGDLREMVRLE